LTFLHGPVVVLAWFKPPEWQWFIRLTTIPIPPRLFTFPSGDFSDFNNNSGTTEFYDIDGVAGTLYILPANVTSYGKPDGNCKRRRQSCFT